MEGEKRRDPKAVVLELWEAKYSDASAIFLAGSVIRGEATAFSDLDLVVMYESVEQARRESFFYGGWPIEAFVHDENTLKYFFEDVDGPSGCPSLPKMVIEGFVIPNETELSNRVKNMAQQFVQAGPPKWDQQTLNNARYAITDLIDDLRAPRNNQEVRATGSQLYQPLADFYFRGQGEWSAKGKTIPRALEKFAPEMAEDFLGAFDLLFAQGDASAVVVLAEKILAPYGGFFFEGHELAAPAHWRK